MRIFRQEELLADERTHIASLTPDPKNARVHNPRNIGLIVEALHEVGAARSIVIDEHNVILAGNGAIEAAADAGIERVRIIDADGDEIIAVRRSNLTDRQKVLLALYDNRAAELAQWDTGMLADIADAMGADIGQLWREDELAAVLAAARTVSGTHDGGILNQPIDGEARESGAAGGRSAADSEPSCTCPSCGYEFIP